MAEKRRACSFFVNGQPPEHQHSDNSAPMTRLKFWGVRGSIATPGPETVGYGGNTSCVELRVNGEIIILDAGTGIRALGLALEEEFKDLPIRINLLITHTHWDHIQGFPFFLPAYKPKNIVKIFGFDGARQGLQNTLSSQMESPYFPISMEKMPSNIAIKEIQETTFTVGSVAVQAQFMKHTGLCAGYRLETPGGAICYLPDVELEDRVRKRWLDDTIVLKPGERDRTPAEDVSLIEFIRDAEALIIDSQYDVAEYSQHVGWGHSCAEDSVAFALHAGVKRLYMFHHDPDHTDAQLAKMVERARQIAGKRRSPLIVEAAREGFELVLPPKKKVKSDA